MCDLSERVRERSVLLWGAASGDFGPYTISAFTEDATINSDVLNF